jgi:hypothetical protein
VILVIDGLTQLDDKEDAHALAWLPAQLPAKVKVSAGPTRSEMACADGP